MTQLSTAQTQTHSLATFIRHRSEAGEPPYVLVLGAGASLASGASSTAHIIETVVQEHGGQDPASLSWEEKLAAFYGVLDSVSARERYLILSHHLKGAEPSAGYHHLASLVKAGYFDLILTTNFDLFLENALMDAGLRSQDFTVLINGQDREEQIIRALRFSTPRIKILKLHGDLNARIFAFTPEEVFQFTERIERALTDILNGDIVVVGHSMRDDDLNRCIRANDGALWYINPDEPSVADFAGRAILARGTPDHIISGKLGRFDDFFAWLRWELLLAEVSLDSKGQSLLEEMRACQRQGDSPGMAEALSQLAKACAKSSHRALALLCYECSVAFFREVGDKSNTARALRELGTLHANLDHLREAMYCYWQSRSLSDETGDQKEKALTLAMMGRWYWAARRSSKATQYREKAIAYWKECLPVLQEFNLPEARKVERWLREAEELEVS